MNIINAKDLKKRKTTALIYGAPGAGKTTALGELSGKTLLIDIDHSSDVLIGKENVDIAFIKDDLSNLPEVIEELEAGHDYDNICVDNLSELEHAMLTAYGRVGNNDGIPCLQDYSKVNYKIMDYVRRFRGIKGNIIFTAWEIPKDITAPTGEKYNQFQPDLRDKVQHNVCGLCNVVGRLKMNEEGDRIVQLSSTKDTYAKDQINKRKWCETKEVIID